MTDTPHQPLFSNYVLSSWKTGPERRLRAPTLNPTDGEGAGSCAGRCLYVLASLHAGRYVFASSKNLLGIIEDDSRKHVTTHPHESTVTPLAAKAMKRANQRADDP